MSRSAVAGNVQDQLGKPDSDKHFARLSPLLRCPQCGSELRPQVAGFCCSCARDFPIVDNVLRFVTSEAYAGNFGFEWSKYDRTQLDHEFSNVSEQAFLERTGFTPQQLRGKWVLDVGCGMGRFAEVAARWGANVVGIDLSQASSVAARNLAAKENVWICQASVFELPFASASFDYIYSIGVLHHTPDCEQAFKCLPRLLKPGGAVAIWLYSGCNRWYRMSDIYRRVTTRLSPATLHALCVAVDPLYYISRALLHLPVIGRPLSSALLYLVPLSTAPEREWRLLDTFDWYSPKYQSKHTYEEVFRWFEDCGLERLRVILQPIAVQGTKPTEPSAANPLLAD